MENNMSDEEQVQVSYSRSLEEISEALDLANVKESELKQISQVLLPPTRGFEAADYRLIELDSNLLKALEQGSGLCFKGDDKTDRKAAVLCTKNRTYDIKDTEISDVLLLAPNVKLANDVGGVCPDPEDRVIEETRIHGQFHNYFEVKEYKPNLKELLTLLQPTAFDGLEYEKKLDRDKLYDWEKLENHIQASEDELREAFSEYLIADIDGYFRLVAFDFEARAFGLMLDILEENSWEIDEVDKEITYESLQEFMPRSVFDLIFHKYTEPGEKKNAKGETLWRYKEDKCCKFLAQILLAASPVNNFDHFMESWTLAAPEKLKPDEKHLRGIALVKWNPQKMKKEVISFSESHLSQDIVSRLNELFKVKDKWTVDEITPYISRCTTPNADVNALLTKYARSSAVNGIKYYSSKHGK
ncbi:sister chromatid cohesion protein DCC1 [Venturia canescens]|uniref:sister chromatid cohesion protein DCC1 n=1 Tax=Venturia canescens TaxID=32260 RepID=UPI001C9CFD1A|nr:sister chromatid cohesion protein DCC1 [Venturia canescens]